MAFIDCFSSSNELPWMDTKLKELEEQQKEKLTTEEAKGEGGKEAVGEEKGKGKAEEKQPEKQQQENKASLRVGARRPREPDMNDELFEKITVLFNENFGVWASPAPGAKYVGEEGRPIRITTTRLKAQYADPNKDVAFSEAYWNDEIIAYAFACYWKYGDRKVCWITHLMVHRKYRERRFATLLLRNMPRFDAEIFGILSPHPAGCKALYNAWGRFGFENVDMDFIENYAGPIMKASPIPYINEASPSGTLFDSNCGTGLKCGANTSFYIDHKDTAFALERWKKKGGWPLGSRLPPGREFLYLFESPGLNKGVEESRMIKEAAVTLGRHPSTVTLEQATEELARLELVKLEEAKAEEATQVEATQEGATQKQVE